MLVFKVPQILIFYYKFSGLKALVVCLRLHFTKDQVVANTASATVRQLVSAVMERIVAEDRVREENEAKYGQLSRYLAKIIKKFLHLIF